jgi:HlyD family secretion protein
MRSQLFALAALALGAAMTPAQAASGPANSTSVSGYVAAAPGLVEPLTEERQIAAQVTGVIGQMRVGENDRVVADQPIAFVENSEQLARVAVARAQLAEAQAQLDKLLNGARPEERREAKDQLGQIDAELDMARLDHDRNTFSRAQGRAKDRAKGAASPAAPDQARSALLALKMRRAAMAERLALIEKGPRDEDIAAARATVARLKAETALAEAHLEKFTIRSPIAGVILRLQRRAGEAVTSMDPVAIVGDLSRLRVRAEVDETDIGRIALGQRVEVYADAFPNRTFGGAVARIAQRFGAKDAPGGRPAEKADLKVLQVMIDLDPGVRLPVGLRVDVRFRDGAVAQH